MPQRNDNGEAAREFYDQRRLWAEYASTLDGLSDRGFRVGYWLSRRMNGEDQSCWYSVKRIAKEMGKSQRYIRYALADLKEARVMLIIEEPGKPNLYKIRAPFF